MAKLAFIGDEMTATGMRLAGLEDSYVATAANVQEVYKKAKEDADIVAMTHSLFESVGVKDEDKINVRIPDMTGGGGDMIKDIVKRVVGFEVKSDG